MVVAEGQKGLMHLTQIQNKSSQLGLFSFLFLFFFFSNKVKSSRNYKVSFIPAIMALSKVTAL